MISWIKNKWNEFKAKRARKRRLAELKKQDPFIYD
jgi:hypothetical protein